MREPDNFIIMIYVSISMPNPYVLCCCFMLSAEFWLRSNTYTVLLSYIVYCYDCAVSYEQNSILIPKSNSIFITRSSILYCCLMLSTWLLLFTIFLTWLNHLFLGRPIGIIPLKSYFECPPLISNK